MRRRLLGIVVLAAVVAGCDDPDSEEGQLAFSDPEFSRDHDSGDRVLAGTRYCPVFSEWFDEEGGHSQSGDDEHDGLGECFTTSLNGPGTLGADGCIGFEDVGEVVWELQPQDCELARDAGITFAPDRVRFGSVAAEDVAAIVSPWRECYALEALEPDPADAYADAWVPEIEMPVLVAAEGPFELEVMLAGSDACDEVGWSMRGASIDGDTAGAQIDPGETARALTVTVDEDAVLDLVLQLPGIGDFPVSRIQGVAPEDVTTLQVVALYERDGDARLPLAVRGIARDEDGSLVRAAPIEWSLEAGQILLTDEDFGPEYALAQDVCMEPDADEEERHATVKARLGDLEASIDLTWTPAPASGEPFVPDERCPASASQVCGCGQAGNAPGAAIFSCVLLLALRRRNGPTLPRPSGSLAEIDHPQPVLERCQIENQPG